MRRFGEPVKPGQSYRRRPGAYAILIRDGQILLTHQASPHSEIQLPGGGIDPGEAPIPALHREIYEETGWHMAQPRRLGAYKRFTYMPEYKLWAEKLCHIYVARPTLRKGPPTEAGHTALWLPAETAIEALSNSGDRSFLIDYLMRA
ncbi:MAG: NUDIX hydrolase [Mangrovicoccus sp.]